jgi:hypothetical protein
MTVFTSAAVWGLVTASTCGGVPANSELAPRVAATAMVESGGDMFAIGINANPARGLPAGKMSATSAAEAVAKATALLAQGRNIDLGIMQINIHQLDPHHLTLATAFDACANVRAGAEHLADDHAWTLAHRRYNCGGTDCGVAYAQTVTGRVHQMPVADAAPGAPPPPPPCAPAWDAWATAACSKPPGIRNPTVSQEPLP